jgi:hypothetical protein
MTGQSVTVVVYKSWVWCLVVDKVTCDSVLVVGYEKPVATEKKEEALPGTADENAK